MLGRRRRYLPEWSMMLGSHHANHGGIANDGSSTEGVVITVTFVVGDDV